MNSETNQEYQMNNAYGDTFLDKDEKSSKFQENKKIVFIIIAFSLMLVIALITVLMGTYDITFSDVFNVIKVHLLKGDISSLNEVFNTIVWEIRLPRIIVAMAVGMALATSGAVYQGTFRNPLVEPFILGVSAGASFGASLGILYPQIFVNIQISSFIFAVLSVIIAYLLSRVEGKTPVVTLILAGVIISSIFQALLSIMKYISDDTALRAIVFWTMGGFYYSSWTDVVLLVPILFISFLAMWYLSWRLNILSMGDEEARSLGVNPDILKMIFIIVSTLMTAIAVSSVGIIAWVGLMMPHAARMILGPDNRFVLPAAAIMGAVYLLICDTIARTLTSAEIPISIITSLLGAPYLFYLLRTKGRYIFSS